MENKREEVDIRSFNVAKRFAEDILFPLMKEYRRGERMVNLGADSPEEASTLPREIREINRFNGLKIMVTSTESLIDAISSTIMMHNNKEEIEKKDEIIGQIEKIIELFYTEKERFFEETYENKKRIEVINRKYFNEIRKKIRVHYVNVEVLMTRNKLLFSDSKDEFASDAEIMEEIKREYSGE